MARKKRETLLQSQQRKLRELRAAKAAEAREEEKRLKREQKQSADDFQYEEQVGDNRIESQKDTIRDLGDPEDMMLEIMTILDETVVIPDLGEVYTYIYNAKTPKLKYDQHPLVAVTHIDRWGFKGLNFHWNQVRTTPGMRYQENYILLEQVNFNHYLIYPTHIISQTPDK